MGSSDTRQPLTLARIWIGHTRLEDRAEYVRYLEKSGMAAYRAIPGNRGAFLLVRELENRAEFLTLSFWDGWDSIRTFAGEDPGRARYFPDDERFLLDFPKEVRHYEVCSGGAPEGGGGGTMGSSSLGDDAPPAR
jgi:hypothetical protein